MTWKELVADPNLQDLPYKIETNEWGQIVMTPTRNLHGAYQFKIASILDDLLLQAEQHGTVVTESAIQTAKGTKVADVAWYSDVRWVIVKDEYDASIAPKIYLPYIAGTTDGNNTSDVQQLTQLDSVAAGEAVLKSMKLSDSDYKRLHAQLQQMFDRGNTSNQLDQNVHASVIQTFLLDCTVGKGAVVFYTTGPGGTAAKYTRRPTSSPPVGALCNSMQCFYTHAIGGLAGNTVVAHFVASVSAAAYSGGSCVA